MLWLLLSVLPLRGWANLTMHLSAQDAPVVAPCHGVDEQLAAQPADATTACTLCDVCHGAVLLLQLDASQATDRRAQPLPPAGPAAAPAAEPSAFFRRPRR